ncbi:MAG: site-2 protease family protein [Gammaproteobacteria bacterium]|jgi:hypothetical protein
MALNEKFLKNYALVILIAYVTLCIGILLHEWGHSTMAFIFGLKSNPFNIHYSHRLFMLGISEHVDYQKAALLMPWKAILISAAGPLVNFILIILSLIFVNLLYKKANAWITFIFYCFYFWNMNEWFNYLIIRDIFPRGDVAHMIKFGMPHWILLLIGILTGVGFLYLLFKKVNIKLFSAFKLTPAQSKKFTRTIIIVFIVTQGITLYNDLFMY